MHADTPMPLRIANIADVAQGIRSFELVQPDGSELPEFTPGSHIKVQAPNGEVRKYSLCNDPNERHRYVIAVKREEQGRGGSISMHTGAKVGDMLPTSVPENAFPLVEGAKAYLFIAGGIGITPILSMIRSFGELPPAPWKLFFLTRDPGTTPFLDEFSQPPLKSQVRIHHDHGDPARSLDLWPVLAEFRARVLLRPARFDGIGARHDGPLVARQRAFRELRRGRGGPARRQALHCGAGALGEGIRGAGGQIHPVRAARARLRGGVVLRERHLRHLPYHPARGRRGPP
jgi:ferredoxin-NADP reductase